MRRPLLAALATALLAACDPASADIPVNVYVQSPEDCGALWAVSEAVERWTLVADVPLVLGECEPSDHALSVTAAVRADGHFDLAALDGLDLHRGEVPVFLVDEITAQHHDGTEQALDGLGLHDRCARGVAMVNRTAPYVAHELGHILGLGHDDRAGNVMDVEPPAAWWVDGGQLATTERTARECS